MINLSIPEPENNLSPRITVLGVGGAGGNAVNNMIRSSLEGCDFVVANTDSQALQSSLAPRKIQLGVNHTRGLGAGSRPEIGRAAAEEQLDDIMDCLQNTDMVFVTAGMGGGTGTGAAPVIARAARESGILTVGVVTKPFHFEGNRRMQQAEKGLAELQQYVDTLIIIPNQNLFRMANEKTTFADAFRMADEVLHCGVRGITDLMVMPGFMNLDFADVKTVMGEMGKAMMGTGEADGENRAIRAAEAAISNPLLDDVSMKGARGVLINITGGYDMTLFEVDQAANRIREEVDGEAQIKVGSTLSDGMDGRMRVSVIATGIDADTSPQASRTAAGGGTAQTTGQTGLRSQQQAEQRRSMAQIPQSYGQGSAASAQNGGAATPHTVPAQARASEVAPVEVPQTAVARSVESPAVQQAALHQHHGQGEETALPRGREVQGQFVAPQPVEPVKSSVGASAAQAASGSVASVVVEPQSETRITSIAAQPPQSSPHHERDPRRLRRTESLFTRITGFGLVRPSEEQDAFDGRAQRPTQQRLGLDQADQAAGGQEEEDNLDIPAFLRRQTNH